MFFAPEIKEQLYMMGKIIKRARYIKENVEEYEGKKLGILVAEGMTKFLKRINFPTTFDEVGVDDTDIQRILTAAKNPQLWSKLDQAPISLIAQDENGTVDAGKTEENIDTYMGALLDGIRSGDFEKIKIMPGNWE